MNTQFAVINTKASEILANTPKYDFVGEDEEGNKYKKLRELFWEYIWLVSKTDAAIYQIIMDSLKYGIGVGKEIWCDEKRTIKKPTKLPDGTIVFNEEVITEYEGCKLIYIPWKNVWMNGRNIEQSTEAAVVTFY